MPKFNSHFNSQGFIRRMHITSFCVCALFCALFFNDVILLQLVRLMACGKPSGSFSHNPAEGYRIPSSAKNHPKPLHPKERIHL